MNVLFAAAEMAPFAKAGGLADVVGSLPKALRSMGVDARVVMPLHGFIPRGQHNIAYAFHYQFGRRRGTADIYVHSTEADGVPVYFLESYPFFGQGWQLYTDTEWDKQRFIAFSEFTLALAWQLAQREGWKLDVLHVHDWHTALGSFLVAHSRFDPFWQPVGTVLTIHNMGYQGDWAGAALFDAGIPARAQPDLHYHGKDGNLLAIALAYSDMITTVSPRYAEEIQYPRFGEGLEGLVRWRAYGGDVMGILNGLDMARNDPATDPALLHPFSVENLAPRPLNKTALQAQLGLAQRPDVPLIGAVTRLTAQKGFDLAIPALHRLLADEDVQVIVLGSGEPHLEDGLRTLEYVYGSRMRAVIGYDPVLSQRIYAASDLFLMPSRYEPCGTSQMLAMRYGALPVVRETGGLADTVQNYDNGAAEVGTGFVFLWETPDAVLGTLRWALETYRQRPEAFRRMQQRAMQTDFSWTKSAAEYVRVYERAFKRHRGG